MTKAVVLDANVIAKLIIDEPNSEEAKRLFDRDDLIFYVPSHALAEVLEVVCRKVRDNQASEQQLAMALIWLSASFVSIAIDGLFESAARLSVDQSISVYDALYVALAVDREIRLVTYDRKLAQRLSGTSVARHIILLKAAEQDLALPMRGDI